MMYQRITDQSHSDILSHDTVHLRHTIPTRPRGTDFRLVASGLRAKAGQAYAKRSDLGSDAVLWRGSRAKVGGAKNAM
jgi:hypothetical protein